MNLHKSIIVAIALTAFAVALPAMADEDKTVTVEKTTTTSWHVSIPQQMVADPLVAPLLFAVVYPSIGPC